MRRVLSKGRAVVAGRRRVRSGDARKHEEPGQLPEEPREPAPHRDLSSARERERVCVCARLKRKKKVLCAVPPPAATAAEEN